MDDEIHAISKFQQPQKVDNVRSFLGLCGYYRPFIKNFPAMASPLTKLLKKEVPFHWNPAQETSFLDLKEAVTVCMFHHSFVDLLYIEIFRRFKHCKEGSVDALLFHK